MVLRIKGNRLGEIDSMMLKGYFKEHGLLQKGVLSQCKARAVLYSNCPSIPLLYPYQKKPDDIPLTREAELLQAVANVSKKHPEVWSRLIGRAPTLLLQQPSPAPLQQPQCAPLLLAPPSPEPVFLLPAPPSPEPVLQLPAPAHFAPNPSHLQSTLQATPPFTPSNQPSQPNPPSNFQPNLLSTLQLTPPSTLEPTPQEKEAPPLGPQQSLVPYEQKESHNSSLVLHQQYLQQMKTIEGNLQKDPQLLLAVHSQYMDLLEEESVTVGGSKHKSILLSY